MKRTSTLLAAAKVKRSLALNVHFKHPDLGMKDYEILSRATAFLLSVDPPNPSTAVMDNMAISSKTQGELDAAGGPHRHAKDLGWLEFCPSQYRPLVHVVAASHVLSPWLWKQYYPQPWLEMVSQDHVRYSVSVYDVDANSQKQQLQQEQEPLATFGLNPYPIHHPNDMDLALVHLKSEDATLKQFESLGVDMLHLTDTERLFDKDDEVLFEGFEITEEHYEAMEQMNDNIEADKGRQQQQQEQSEEDTRVFIPYSMKGNLIFASQDRFLARTDEPLPEGVCGGPVLDDDGRVCGVVEGIVPVDHEEKAMAGAASFIPYFRIKEFVQYAERIMLERIVPKTLFDKVVDLKKGKALNERSATTNLHGQSLSGADDHGDTNLDKAYGEMMENIRRTHSPEQVETILGTVEREHEEVLEMIENEGGDLDEIIAKVRAKTRERQKEILEQLEHESESMMQEAEVVSNEEEKNTKQ